MMTRRLRRVVAFLIPGLLALALIEPVAGAAPAGAQLCSPAGGPSGEFTVTGWVGEERTYDAADLAALPQTTVADTFLSGGGSASANYTGVELWRLLGLPADANTVGDLLLPNDPPGPQGPDQRNDITRYSVVVTGTDCFQAVYAMTEISPFFGGQPVVVATAEGEYDPEDLTPVTGSLGDAGFARISNPVDLRGSRRVSNIAEIRVIGAPAVASTPPAGAAQCAGGPSDELTVTGWVTEDRTYDAAGLAALPQTTVADSFRSGSGSTSVNYTGVDLWRLLGLSADNGAVGDYIRPNGPGPQYPEPQKNDLTRYTVMVTGTDCLQGLFSLAEISPFFGGRPVVVATAEGEYDPADLTPVTGSLGEAGFARISNPVDVRGSRRVATITEIRVLPAPTPVVEWATPAAIEAGTPLGDEQLAATAGVDGSFAYDPPAGTVLPAGTHELTALFTPSFPSSLTIARTTATLTVESATEPTPTPSPTEPGEELPDTGGPGTAALLTGVLLLAAGAVLVRRRRPQV